MLEENTVNIEGANISLTTIRHNKNRAIIFVHGAGKTKYTWEKQHKLEVNYDLIFLDLPGHGKSTGKGTDSIEEYSIFLQKLMKILSHKEYILVGHSMGGAISLTIALEHLARIKALVLVDTSARLKVGSFVFDSIESGDNVLIKWAYCERTSPNVIKLGEKDFKHVSKEVRYNDFKACDKFDVRETIHRINIPTLILVGECDKLTPPKSSEFMHSQIKNSLLEIIPNAGHMSMWENPEKINSQIENFILKIDKLK